MPTPQVLLNDIRTGPPVACKNLELVPLLRNEPARSAIDYILAAEALDRGILRVAEVDEGGSVPELRAVSVADVAILLLDGEELIGAKQNRILNTDMLLRPHAKKMIPVSCVEQGRWHHTRPDFAVGSHAPPPIRAKKSRSVGRSLRESNTARSSTPSPSRSPIKVAVSPKRSPSSKVPVKPPAMSLIFWWDFTFAAVVL